MIACLNAGWQLQLEISIGFAGTAAVGEKGRDIRILIEEKSSGPQAQFDQRMNSLNAMLNQRTICISRPRCIQC